MKFIFPFFVIFVPATRSWFLPQRPPEVQSSLNEILKRTEHHDFSKLYVSQDLTTVYSVDKVTGLPTSTKIHPLVSQKVVDQALKSNTPMYFLPPPINPLPDLISFTVIGAILWSVVMNSMVLRNGRGGGGGGGSNMFGLGESRIQVLKGRENITLADWGGSKEVLAECTEIISYLKNATDYQAVGAEVPRGILLEGAPGTGKTLLAKAMANEADANFIAMSGSEFIEVFVGVGAQRIRQLFAEARKNRPCLIFIDEIDAIGRKRGQSSFMTNTEGEQTLNQLLTEMDGFNDNEDIIVIAATNRRDILDDALTRPGRFDRIIKIPLPDARSRRDILNVHLRNKNIDPEVDLDALVDLTGGYSGAELKNLVNEASIHAARTGQKVLTKQNLLDALEKVAVGIVKKTDDRSNDVKRRVAIHEIGHALMAMTYKEYFNLQKVSIQATYSGAGGYTIFTERPEISEGGMYTKDLLKKRLVIALGGKAAESVFYGDDFVSAGATQDLSQANQLAMNMIERFGMGTKLTTWYKGEEGFGNQKYSESTRFKVDAEVAKLVDEAYQEAKKIVEGYREKMGFAIRELLDNVNLSGGEFGFLME
jgi:cell division protease FtsH